MFGRNVGGTDNWGQLQKIVPPGINPHDWIGHAVAVVGDTEIVAGHRQPNNPIQAPGKALVCRGPFGP